MVFFFFGDCCCSTRYYCVYFQFTLFDFFGNFIRYPHEFLCVCVCAILRFSRLIAHSKEISSKFVVRSKFCVRFFDIFKGLAHRALLLKRKIRLQFVMQRNYQLCMLSCRHAVFCFLSIPFLIPLCSFFRFIILLSFITSKEPLVRFVDSVARILWYDSICMLFVICYMLTVSIAFRIPSRLNKQFEIIKQVPWTLSKSDWEKMKYVNGFENRCLNPSHLEYLWSSANKSNCSTSSEWIERQKKHTKKKRERNVFNSKYACRQIMLMLISLLRDTANTANEPGTQRIPTIFNE